MQLNITSASPGRHHQDIKGCTCVSRCVSTGMEGSISRSRLQVLSNHLAPQHTSAQLNLQACSGGSSGFLTGKVAIITGAGKGIGEAAAKLMAQQGARLVVSDLDQDAATKVVNDIKAAGGEAVAVCGDVTLPEMPQRIVQAAVSAYGRIDILVNNAGFTWDGVVQKMTEAQWDMMLKVHCTAPFRLIQAAEPYMRGAGKQEGAAPAPRHIINISSTSGTHGHPGQANYSTAKAGVVGLTKTIAKEWGPFGVRCNALAFGLIDTRLIRPRDSGEVIQVGGQQVALGIPTKDNTWAQFLKSVPLRRAGSAEEAAGTILMLCSPWASYITGQVLEVNGGSYM